MQNFSYCDITFEWQSDAKLLTVANSRLQRIIDFSAGLPRTRKFTADQITASQDNETFDFRLAGFPAPGNETFPAEYQVQNVEFARLALPDGDGAQVTVTVYEEGFEQRLQFTYILYRDLPVMAMQTGIVSEVTPMLFYHPRHTAPNYHYNDKSIGTLTICDQLTLTDFVPQKSVEFQMRTDYNDEPVLEHAIVQDEPVFGNILIAENPSGAAFFYLQEAQPSSERRGNEPGDFVIEESKVASLGSGIMPCDVTPGRELLTNRTVCGVAADGNAGKLIKEYLYARQPETLKVAGQITVNPWGCGKFPKLVSEDFLKGEIVAASKLHADTYQIDDGYEHGLLVDLQVRNHKLSRDFWKTRRDLLPEDFTPLVKLAAENNIKLSLWFAPSCNREYRDWRESADILLEHLHKNNFDSFKLDAVVLNSYTAEENFGKLLKALYDESNQVITVNLDVTSGSRGGLFKFAEYGLLFLENRYCCHRWPRNPYHPENTLDNLWNLAKYTRIQNLQIEVPNPGDCLNEAYEAKNMTVPTTYPARYWAMIPLFASPLLWMAPSQVSVENAAAIGEVMQMYRQHRQAWKNALISPVGSRPNGAAISGFYADSGYLLVFREADAPAQSQLDLPEYKQAELIYSTAPVELDDQGKVTFAEPRSAALYKLTL